jgi:sulfatase modifying factor 1
MRRKAFMGIVLASALLGAWSQGLAGESDQALMQEMGMKFVGVEGGTFQMGNTFGDDSKGKAIAHSITLDAFLISTTEVTFAQYDRFTAATGREKLDDEGWGRGNRPVIHVDWDEAVAFCAWLSKEAGHEFRLPTEAEWEYAAREAGRKVRFGNGRDIADPAEINFNSSKEFVKAFSRAGEYRQQTVPVASFQPNALGLYDMSGNVWEWCSDWYEKNYYRTGPEVNPQGGATGTYRVVRGGSWKHKPTSSSGRAMLTPDSAEFGKQVGFRVARSN